MLHTGGDVGGLGGDVGQAVVGDQGGGLGVVEDVGHFVAAVGGVDGHGDAADEGQAEPGVENFGHVGQEQADAVAVADAQDCGTYRRPGGTAP